MTGQRNNPGPRSASKRSSANATVTETPLKILKMPVPSTYSSDNSASTAIESYIRLLREEVDCDMTFLVGSSQERIQCHQVFLKARSPVFQVMFSQRWNEGKEVEIPDIDPQTFRAFLEFVYADKFVSTVSDAVKLLYAAHKYQVQLLVNNIEKLVGEEMKLEDSVAVFQAAREIENKKLMKLADEMMAGAESLEVLAKDDIIMEMDKQTITHLLSRNEMRAKELDLFNTVVKWGNVQVKRKREQTLNEALADVIPLIRFPLMSPHEIASVVVPTGLLGQDDLIQVLLYLASDKNEQKNREKQLKFSAAPRKALGPATSVIVPFYGGPMETQCTTGIMSLKDEIGFRPYLRGTETVIITGIILHCLTRNTMENSAGDEVFSISILESDSITKVSTNFEVILKISPLQLQWGEEMEVKVEVPAVLHHGCDYLIKLEQISRPKYGYHYRTCGTLTSPDVNLNDMFIKLNRMRNYSNAVPVIYKIRVAEQNSG